MIRQRNIDPRSDIGTATFNAALSALQADAAVGGVYVTDCESVDIIECGISGVVSGTSPTIDMSVRVGNDALNITTFNGGTTAFFPPGTTFRLTATGSKVYRPADPLRVAALPQTLIETTKKGLAMVLNLDFGGTTPAITGQAWFSYRVNRAQD